MQVIFRHPLWKKHGMKFLRFAVCGGFGACIDFGTLHVLVGIQGWEEKYALLVSTGFAMVFVFIANRFFTFRVKGGKASTQLAKFLSVYLIAAALNYCFSLFFIWIGLHYFIAKALAIGMVMFFNYFSLNGYVFKQREPAAEEVFTA